MGDVVKDFVNKTSEVLKYDSRNNNTFREICEPAWVPDSYARSRLKNIYLNMLNPQAVGGSGSHLDFYTESGGSWKDKIRGMLTSAVTAVTNQVGAIANTIQGICDSVASIFGAEGEDEPPPPGSDIGNQPMMTVYGWNPIPSIGNTMEILKSAVSAFKTIVNTEDGFGEYFENVKKALITTLKEEKIIESDTVGVNDIMTKQHGMAESFLLHSVNGTCMMKAKIPMLNNDSAFISAHDAKQQWKGGMSDSESMMSTIAKSTGMNIGYVSPMSWIAESLERCNPVQTRFTLFNDTAEHLAINFAFIMAFAQTAMPVTGGAFMRAPFFYDIILPHGVKYYACTCDLDIKAVGKLRKMGDSALASLGGAISWHTNIGVDSDILTARLKKLNANNMLFFPDAYEVTMRFSSLLPNSWNFISGWMSDSGDLSIPTAKEERNAMTCTLIKKFTENLEKLSSGKKTQKQSSSK